jgi:hypothetical protein
MLVVNKGGKMEVDEFHKQLQEGILDRYNVLLEIRKDKHFHDNYIFNYRRAGTNGLWQVAKPSFGMTPEVWIEIFIKGFRLILDRRLV